MGLWPFKIFNKCVLGILPYFCCFQNIMSLGRCYLELLAFYDRFYLSER